MKQMDDLNQTIIQDTNSSKSLQNGINFDNEIIKSDLQGYQKTNAVKKILFACEDCSGPLVPISQCVVCKKTSSRRCVNCYTKVNLDIHRSCECLIIFTNIHANGRN